MNILEETSKIYGGATLGSKVVVKVGEKVGEKKYGGKVLVKSLWEKLRRKWGKSTSSKFPTLGMSFTYLGTFSPEQIFLSFFVMILFLNLF